MTKTKLIPIAMLMSLFLSTITFASSNTKIISSQTKENGNSIIVTKKYETTNENGDVNVFNTRINVNGIEYEIKKANKSKPIDTRIETQDKYIYDSATVDKKEDLENIPEEIQRNGKTYKLVSSEIKEQISNGILKHEEKEVEVKGLEASEKVPETTNIILKTIDDKDETYTLPLSKIISEESEWTNTFAFPIEISDYDADIFMLNGVQILKTDPLINYKDAFLEYLNLPKDFYVIESINWDGDEYSKNGIVYRKAIAKGRKKVRNVKALYSGDIEVNNIKEYYSENTYVSVNEDGSINSENNTIYTFEESAEYNKINNVVSSSNIKNNESNNIIKSFFNFIKNNKMIALSIGSIALIGLILSILIFFAKDKKDKKENKVEIIDFDKKERE